MRIQGWTGPTTAALTVLLLTGCGLNSYVEAGAATPATDISDQAAAAEQQRLATSIKQLRVERDALQKRAAAPSAQATTAPSPTPTKSTVPRTQPATRHPVAAPKPPASAAAGESFASLSRRLGGEIGLAYAPMGARQPATRLGTLGTGVGWSTVKVPVAIATVKQANGHPGQDTMRLMRLAITQSDNNAAMTLWSRLGSPNSAAAKTQAALRAGGDTHTVVPSTAPRAGYTPFGQSSWSLADQATFAASLPCTPNTGPVLALMAQVTPSQRWGVGALSSTQAFKGGWGPGTNGAYLVRQMAVARLPDGSRIGLSLAARPADGRFETGVQNLNALARWAITTIRTGGATRC